MNRNDPTWNPWHGCHKYSEGCANCFMFYLDETRQQDGSDIHKNKTNFDLPLKKDRLGNYKIKPGSFVRVCMSSDFFLAEADAWRDEAWDIIRQRKDITFSLLTKRVERIEACLPDDWNDGWDHVHLAVSCENQRWVDFRLPILLKLKAKHKWVSIKPFIGEVDLDKYLESKQIETVLAGGENYGGKRPLHYEWVKKIYEQCLKYDVEFIFGQTGNVFVKDGKTYHIDNYETQIKQALASGLQNRKPDAQALIFDFIRKQKLAIISSVDEMGYPATRALIQPVHIEGNDLYFATYEASRKVRHYRNNAKACVYFYEAKKQYSGVELKGEMEVLCDMESKQRFYKPFFKRFYKLGVNDPQYCIIKFRAKEAFCFVDQQTKLIVLNQEDECDN